MAFVTLLAVILWSSAYPVMRYLALSESNPFLVSFYRTFFTSVIFLLILLVKRKSPSFVNFKSNWPVLLGMALTGVVGMFLALTIGLQYVPAGKSTLINSINPALIVIFAHIIFHEPLGWSRISGLLLSIIGVIFVITGNDLNVWHHLSFQPTDLFFLFSGCCWAAYSLMNRILGNKMGYMEGLFWVFACATVLLFPVAIIFRDDFTAFSPKIWLWVVYLGLIPGAMGNYFWFKGIMAIGAASAGLINSFLPLFAIIISYFTLGEVLAPMQLIGAGILILGVWLGSIRIINLNKVSRDQGSS